MMLQNVFIAIMLQQSVFKREALTLKSETSAEKPDAFSLILFLYLLFERLPG